MKSFFFRIFMFLLPFLAKYFGSYNRYLIAVNYVSTFPENGIERKEFILWLFEYNRKKYNQ